jgi:uncharacterized integral membrane protein
LVAVALLVGTVIASIAFVLSNEDEVRVELLVIEPFHQPLWLVIAGSFLLGAFAASAGLLFQLARKSLAMRRSEKRLRGLEAELEKLRAASPAITAGDAAVLAKAPPP